MSLDPAAAQPRPRLRVLAWSAAIAACLGLGGLAALASIGRAYTAQPLADSSGPSASTDDPGREHRLVAALGALRPRGVYVVIDTQRNRLQIHRGDELLRDAVCSTGSGVALRDPRSGRLWIFDTPLGERRVRRKVRNPIWVKPDWAFIEEGLQPPKKARERYDDFSLGDYGLYLGDGYIIHGTVFQTLLGRPVTHGCIRLGDEDLEFAYRQVPLGARVYLY